MGWEIVYIYRERSSQGRMKNKHNGDSVLCDCGERQERVLSELDIGSIDSTEYDLCAPWLDSPQFIRVRRAVIRFSSGYIYAHYAQHI